MESPPNPNPESDDQAPTAKSDPTSSSDKKTEPIDLIPLAPLDPNASPPPPPTPVEAKRHSIFTINLRARRLAIIASIVVVVIVAAVVIIFLKRSTRPSGSAGPQTTLTDSQLQKLSANSISYNGGTETLTFRSPTAFNGTLTVNGATTLKDLTVTGSFNPANISVGQALQVGGATLLQGDVIAKGQLNVSGGLIVGGTSSFIGAATFGGNASFGGSLSAASLNVKTAQIGNLSFGHIITSGATPTGALGGGAGAGSFTVSGNDTSGTVIINVGGGAHSGDLLTVSFRSAFTSTPHISLTPINSSSAGSAYYVSRSVTAFTVQLTSPVPGTQYAFDYLVTQ